MDVEQELGQRIRYIRDGRGLSQQQVAARAGITRTHLSHIERGDYSARIDKLYAIAKALSVSLEQLFHGVGR